ncbi:hypothetical protein [Oceanirhabdus sp. W0125-5]|uniref:hypothetical protein n=1 Tax=Oceanirhabdus sp. W0125-5 TaxID=2999116 RepID=UPI0022F2B49F|nr:hypothetical protein [Oceanirhabdus sp. W0125-5]WBW99159.1 hypothetical protein OW730_10550 [Oceanirhabdus sp. W0125-5]
MKGKKVLSIIFSSLVIMSLFSGCNDSSVVTVEEPIKIYKVKEEFDSLKKDNETAQKEKEKLNLSLDELKNENEKLKKLLEERTTELDKLKADMTSRDKEIMTLSNFEDYDELFKILSTTINSSNNQINIIPIYGFDIDTDFTEIISWMPIISSNDLEKNMDVLARYMENNYFTEGHITIEEIIEVDGKSVAIINLKEKDSNNKEKVSMWMSKYFGGSAGGRATEARLKLTFLQPEYSGQWIDGVKFLYEGKPLVLDHVNIPDIIYRQDLIKKANYTVADFIGELGKTYIYSGGFENGGFTREIIEVKDNMFIGISKSTGAEIACKYSLDQGKLKVIYTSEIVDVNHWEQSSNRNEIVLQEPIQIGTSWVNDSYKRSISMITRVGEKVYTKAGLVEDVVEVITFLSDGEYRVEQYAKGIGLIKSEFLSFKDELIEIK